MNKSNLKLSIISGGPDIVKDLTKKFTKKNDELNAQLYKNVSLATNIIYTTARVKRSKISKEERVESGHLYKRRVTEGKNAGKMKNYFVSDPAAKIGVPVDSGDLQSSIRMKVINGGIKSWGEIYIDGPGKDYANRIEFGYENQAPRSFMRAAVHENADKVKKIFGWK